MSTMYQFSTLRHGQVIEHRTLKNSDGTPLRARVNGAMKTWKTRPGEFLLPMKHGLRDCFYIDHRNAADWVLPG
jgi:hypothetical protein